MANSDPLKNNIYYSQNREDLILESFFLDVEKGFYVDVGASDPDHYSVTKLFYEKGWNGINVEPIKHHYQALKTKRPRDINLNIGVGKENATLTFHEYSSGDGLSTFSNEMVNEYVGLEGDIYKDIKEYDVKVLTLKDVLREHAAKSIHFMKVDVEGFEYDVLVGNDWNKYRPEVICIEANHILEDWRPLLETNGYELVFYDGLNNYYVDSKTNRLEKFDYVQNVVLQKDGGIRSQDYTHITNLRNDVAQSQREIENAHLRLQAALAENAQTSKQYIELLAENHNNHARAAIAERALRSPAAFIKYQLKRLHRGIVRKLSSKKQNTEYTKSELENKEKALKNLVSSKTDEQSLAAAQKLAKIETERLERIYRSDEQPLSLKIYWRFVKSVKRLRVRSRS